MVMPRSRSRSFESITRSATVSLSRKVPLWRSMASTSVVLPWSTWAMMAMLRILGFSWKTPQACKLGAYYYFTMSRELWRLNEKKLGQPSVTFRATPDCGASLRGLDHFLSRRAGDWEGSPLGIRCSQSLSEYLSEEDDIMIAPRCY